MILPSTPEVALLLAFASLLCWGSWANTLKSAGWRFELYYYDFSIGAILTALLAGLTLGSLGVELSFLDNFAVTWKRSIAYGLAAGGIFNLANLLLLGGLSVAGMAVSFPLGFAVAGVVGAVWSFAGGSAGALVFAGAGGALAGASLAALAYRQYRRGKQGKKAPGVWKGVLLAAGGGLILGFFPPMLRLAQASELGLRAYATAFVVAAGILLTTPVLNLYFLNLPVSGLPLPMTAYLKGTWRQHLLGILGGSVWCLGMLGAVVASDALPEARVDAAWIPLFQNGSAVVTALWGILAWKEFQGASLRVRVMMATALIVLSGGLAVISFASRG